MRRTWALAVVMLAAAAAHAQTLSPGELGKSHADLEGLSNCTKCHDVGKQLDGRLCLDCHTTLRRRIESDTGMHARAATKKRGCLECHHEHRGEDGALAEWGGPRDKFDHGRTGWDLEGKHAGVKCTNCHDARLVDADVRKRFNARGAMTWLGLRRTCTECHFDEHRGQMKGECTTCHDLRGFKPAPRFNHGKFFRLRGKHARISCASCHVRVKDSETHADAYLPPVQPERYMRYRTDKRNCVDCHKDPHEGAFGNNCAKCHNERSWHSTHAPDREPNFHDKSDFPLEGKHREVSCESCHPRKPGGGMQLKGFPFAACADCHKDAHQGQLTAPGEDASRCERCHDEDGFSPSHYPVEDHANTRFPLSGSHALVACNECHTPAPGRAPGSERLVSRTVFKWPTRDFSRCQSCHQDPHDGEFERHDPVLRCESCHRNPETFSDVTFDHDTAWPLTGPHAKATCVQCHGRGSPGKPVKYAGTPRDCAACHQDVHRGQFRRAGERTTDCLRCHVGGAFKPTVFVHGDPRFSTFSLKGKHAGLPCASCHVEKEWAPGERVTWYVGLPTRCEGCHQDAHAGGSR